MRVGETVASISPTRVRLKSGEQLAAHTLVWGAGLQGNAIVRSLGIDLQRGYRIGVAPDLTVPGHPEVYAVGDIAAIADAKDGDVLPQLGSVAQQSGQQAGHNIAKRLRTRARTTSSTTTRARWRRSGAEPPWFRCAAAGR